MKLIALFSFETLGGSLSLMIMHDNTHVLLVVPPFSLVGLAPHYQKTYHFGVPRVAKLGRLQFFSPSPDDLRQYLWNLLDLFVVLCSLSLGRGREGDINAQIVPGVEQVQ